MKHRILFVDDDSNILDALRRMLRDQQDNWELSFATGGDEALKALGTTAFDTIVMDVAMPGKNGFEVLTEIRSQESTQDVPVVFLTGNTEADLKRQALDLGATDLLNKPVVREDLLARLRSVLRIKTYQDEIKAHKATLERRVEERTRELSESRLGIVWRLGKAAEFRDEDTGLHVVRVGCYCRTVAEALGADTQFVALIFITSPLHDIGKIGIPDGILRKPDRLTPAEWEVMKTHCEIGAQILRGDSETMRSFLAWSKGDSGTGARGAVNPLLEMGASIALSHHERWNGSGYPRGLSGTDIPIESRIVAIADVYDALTSSRPYKEAMPHKQALQIIEEGVGKHFDPEIYGAFTRSLRTILEIRAQFAEPEIDILGRAA